MPVSLVTITHPSGAREPVPHVGGRTPLGPFPILTWQARSIAEQGFIVEVHQEHYDQTAPHFTEPQVTFTEPQVAFTEPQVAFTEPQVAFTEPQVVVPLTPEEIADLRRRIGGLMTLKVGLVFAAEIGVPLDPLPTRLSDLKARLGQAVDEEEKITRVAT